MMGRNVTIFGFVVLTTLLYIGLLAVKKDFIKECTASGHTTRFCEYEFWQ